MKLKQFGFEIGGPIIKKKTFFFGSYQTNIGDCTQPIDQAFGVPIVYTATAKDGIFRYFRASADPLKGFFIENGNVVIAPVASPPSSTAVRITRNSPLLVNPQDNLFKVSSTVRRQLQIIVFRVTIS